MFGVFLHYFLFFYLRDSKFTAINWIFYWYTWTKLNLYKHSEKFKYSEAQIQKLQISTPSVDCLWFCPTCIILLHTSLKPHLHLQVNPLLRLWQWFLLLQRSWQHLRYYCEYYLKCTLQIFACLALDIFSIDHKQPQGQECGTDGLHLILIHKSCCLLPLWLVWCTGPLCKSRDRQGEPM